MMHQKKIKSFIYKSFKRLWFKVIYFFFLHKPSSIYSQNIFDQNSNSKLDIITIAFNNAQIIEYQIRLIKKYLKDDYTHIIADNSNIPEIRKEIYEICNNHGVLYIELPSIKLKPSWSHAAALHWSFKNLIKKRNAPYFGFIDHDIFPIRETCITDKFMNGIFGRVIPAYGAKHISEEQPYWSLWGGFFFFDYSLFKNIDPLAIDFFPKAMTDKFILDTAGGLWDKILSKIKLPDCELLLYKQVPIEEGCYIKNLQSEAYEELGDWLHIVNLSNWYGVSNLDKKLNSIYNKLENIL
jgi:hypothetical protein